VLRRLRHKSSFRDVAELLLDRLAGTTPGRYALLRVRLRGIRRAKIPTMAHQRNAAALRLFGPIAQDYERWAAMLSLGQDPRWRRAMVDGLELRAGERLLDVACGTGSVARLAADAGCEVTALDQSADMLAEAQAPRVGLVRGTAERLPVPDATFDALTFTYLLRYVADPGSCMRELVRVLRPGGRLGMVEFGRPRGLAGAPWWFYTRVVLPATGAAIGHGWRQIGSFLGPSIDGFHRRYPPAALTALWTDAGLVDVRTERRSLGGGLLMWGRRP
jgi:demethylmenaquinone methyltransferase/2-methoxy-6-polyprenyl-1,4-benzoquinol methylase